MARSFEYLIVGGGNAAGYACREFVAQGVPAGRVGMICAEPVLPYERPALTKAYLHPPSAKVRARLPGFHTCVGGGSERQLPEWYAQHGIEVIQGIATSVDLKAKCVKVGDEECTYSKLILATGCSALRVSRFGVQGDDLQNVHYLRGERDAAALVETLEAAHGAGGGEVVILGGGYIGLETAAALVGWGIKVTMVFPESHVMPRLFDAELAQWLEDQYTSRGIVLLKGESVAEFVGTDGKVSGVKLQSGKALPCNIAVVGVGALPNVDYCQGLKMESGGFAVNELMQTSDPDVFAVGDICTFPSSQHGGAMMRCEHVVHARLSAAQAVKAAMGVNPEPYKFSSYFYSRIFEYTDKPIVFNFYGNQTGTLEVVKRDSDSVGGVWMKDGKAVGALLMGTPGPSPEDAAKLAKIANDTPAADNAAAALASVGL